MGENELRERGAGQWEKRGERELGSSGEPVRARETEGTRKTREAYNAEE